MKSINKEELHNDFSNIMYKDDEAFSKLYEKYKDLVYSIAFSILKKQENSEEIVQIVFAKIWKLEKRKLPTANEASWLYTITKNTALDFLRKQKIELNIDEIYYITNEDKEIDSIIEKDTYNKIISKLNRREQEIISLKILSNLSFKEISRILDMPIGTVQWKYYKSIHKLKIILSNLFIIIMCLYLVVIKKISNSNKTSVDKENTMNHNNEHENKITHRPSFGISNETVESNTMLNEMQENDENILKTTQTRINGLEIVVGMFIFSMIFFIFFKKIQQKLKKKSSK